MIYQIKNSYVSALLLMTLLFQNNALHCGGGGPSTTLGNFCTGNYFVNSPGSSCNTGPVALNKVGDKVSYPTAQLTITENFNKITTPTTKTLAIPVPNQDFAKSANLFAFTPTVGSRLIKDQEIKLLIVSYDLNAMPSWTPTLVAQEATNAKSKFPKAKVYVKFYLQRAGQLASQWTEFGTTILAGEALAQPDKLNVKIELQPDAKVTFFLPAYLDDTGKLVDARPLIGDLGRLG